MEQFPQRFPEPWTPVRCTRDRSGLSLLRLLRGWGPLASPVIMPDSWQFRAGGRRDWRGSRLSAAADDRVSDAGGGHSTRPVAVRSSRGQPARSGTGFPSPTASNAPARDDMSPAARSAPARAVGLDHECASSHQPPGSPYLRRLAVHPSQPPRAGHRQKQAAPHLRCGAAGVGAPVQARRSLSACEWDRRPSGLQPQRVVIGRPQLVGYFCPIPHPDDEEADCE